MNIQHYIGFDVHKKSISYCVKTGDGTIVEEGKLQATRRTCGNGQEAARSRGMARWKRRYSADGSTMC